MGHQGTAGARRTARTLGIAGAVWAMLATGSAHAESDYPAPDEGGPWAVTLYGGLVSDNNFTRIFFTPWDSELEDDTPWLAGSLSRRIGGWRDIVTFELEGGAGYRFGDEKTFEVWSALYARYDNFPWNDWVYTSAALSTGLNYASRISPIEAEKSGNGGSKVLHYFSPELTFAAPDRRDLELVLRLHHRSGIFGLFDGVSSGGNIVTLGVRKRF